MGKDHGFRCFYGVLKGEKQQDLNETWLCGANTS